jgi:large subunit ribosomal protein L24
MAWKIKTGDNVIVICGSFKGEEGRVLRVDREKMRVVVEGVNVRSRALRPSPQNPEGGIVKKETPIHISNVALQDVDRDSKGSACPTRVGFRFVDGRKVRYAKRSQKDLVV